MNILIIPGWQGSGPGHWQSLWAERLSGAVRVEQDDWNTAVRDAWVERVGQAVDECAEPPVLVAHSLGCLTVVEWAATHGARARAALLVAPPDMETAIEPSIIGYAPIPRAPLPFPAIVVGSRTDPWMSLDRTREFAEVWGARFHDAGDAGHINLDAGHGPWAEGERLFAELTAYAR